MSGRYVERSSPSEESGDRLTDVKSLVRLPSARARPTSLKLLPLDSQSMNYHYNMTKVLDHVYMGSEAVPSQVALLRSLNITHIINASCSVYYQPPEHIRYVQLDVQDAVDEQIGDKFEETFAIIEEARHRYMLEHTFSSYKVPSGRFMACILSRCSGRDCHQGVSLPGTLPQRDEPLGGHRDRVHHAAHGDAADQGLQVRPRQPPLHLAQPRLHATG
jgi:hypothetical protein